MILYRGLCVIYIQNYSLFILNDEIYEPVGSNKTYRIDQKMHTFSALLLALALAL